MLAAQADGIPPLVGLLGSPDSEVQRYAAKVLYNLTSNDECRVFVAKAGAIEPLVGLLRSADQGTTICDKRIK